MLLSGFYSIREGKYIQNGLVAPCMKPHIGSDNKRISIIYYLNSEKEWKEEKLRTKKGIPFDLELINSFLEIDKKYNLNYFNKLI